MRASTVITSVVALAIVSTHSVLEMAAASPPDEYVSGLLHQPLGDITTFTVDGRRLTACCLGSSGEDGIEIKLHSLHGGGAAVDLTELQTPSPIAREIHIRPKGWDGTIKGSVRLIGNPDGSITEVQDFSTVGVTSIEWRALDASGLLIDQGVVAGPVISYGLGENLCSAKLDCFYRCKFDSCSENANTACDASSLLTITGVTLEPITGVHDFIVKPVTCGGCPDPWSDVESVLITGSGINELVVSESQLRTFGVASWGLGQVHLAEECIGMPPPCASNQVGLVATNIGTSGVDGVAIDLGPGSNGGTLSKHTKTGHVTLLKAFDDEDQELARVTESGGSGTPTGSLTPDFAAIGSVEFDVAYIGTDGSALAVERCSNGTALEVPDPVVHCTGELDYTWKVEEGEAVVLEARLCAPSGPLTLPSGGGVSSVAALRFGPVSPTVAHGRCRRLEITSPDAAEIVVQHVSADKSAYVSGLLHKLLGAITTFAVDGRKLTACCLGSSGEDGIEIRLHSLNGGGAAVDLAELQTPSPIAREIKIRPKGWDGTIKGSVRLIGNPDGSVTEVQDFSTVGVTSIEWRALRVDGTLIVDGVVMGPVITYDLQDVFTSAKVDCFARGKSGLVENQNTLVDFDSVMTISGLTPDPITDVHEFVVTPITCGGCPDPWSDVESVLITGSGINELVVSESQLRTFGLPSWGLGQAHLDEECIGMPPPCASNQVGLVASNLGSSGEDGVAIDLGPGSNGGSVSKEKCRSCSNGHVTLMKLYDDEAHEVGRVAETSGTGIPSGSLAPDFSAIGSVEFDVAYIGTDGSALAVERCSNGTPLEVPEPHVHCAGDVTYDWKVEEGEKVVLEARLCEPSGPITLPSGAGVSGVVSLRIAPVDSTVAHHRVRRLEFVSSNATDIVIHHASASTPVYVSGLPHELLGDMSTYTIDGRKLSACCLGSSGQDGVDVRFDSLHGGGVSVDISSLLGATGLDREIRIQAKKWRSRSGHMVILSDADGFITETYDFTTSGVTEMQWRLRDAFGNVLASGTEPGGVLSWGLDIPDTGVACEKKYWNSRSSSGARSAHQGFFDRVVDVTGLTPMPVSGVQSIEVVPVCAGCPNSPLDDLRSLEVTADGIPGLAVTEAHLRTFGVESWGLGQAHVREVCGGDISYVAPCDADERVLVADNLGSSGQDGVSIDLGPQSSGALVSKGGKKGHVTLLKLYDDEDQETARVTESPGSGTPTGSLTPDFSAIGSLEFDVAYIGTDGSALAVERCSNGTPLEVPDPLVHCTGKISYDWKVEEGEKVVLEAGLCAPSGPLTLPSGGGVSSVAALRLRPVSPTVPHGQCRRLEFTSADAPDIEIHHVSTSKPVYVSGLAHHLLGEVSSYAVDGRKLNACCLGSSGQDGVDLRLDSVHGGGASVDITPLLGATRADGDIKIRIRGWDGTIKGTLRLTSGSGVITEEYDFTTTGVTAMEWRLLNVHGGVLAEGIEPGGVLSWGLDVPDTGVECNKYYSFASTSSAARSANQGFFDRVATVTGLTPDAVAGVSRIEVVPVPCAGCPNGPLDELHSLDVTGEGLDELVLSDAHLATFGVESWGVGQAHIREGCSSITYVGPCDASESVLVVENLGGLGQDGVTLDFGSDSGGGMVAKSKKCPDCPPGHVIIMKAFDDESDETFRLTQSENPMVGQVDLTFDATSLGGTHTEVSFLDTNGAVLVVVPQGPVASVSYFECSEVEQPETLTVASSWCRFTASCTVTDYFVPGVGIVSGVAAVEFEAMGVSSKRAPVRVELTSNDPGGMLIEGASSTPVAIGDIDRDGDIDLVDYAIFAECMAGAKVAFAPPGQCSTPQFRRCDLDKDVDVDLHDFATFQAEMSSD